MIESLQTSHKSGHPDSQTPVCIYKTTVKLQVSTWSLVGRRLCSERSAVWCWSPTIIKASLCSFWGPSKCVCVAQMCFVCVLVPFVRVMEKHNFRSSPSPRLPLTWLQPPCHWQQSPGLQCLKCTAVAACTAPYLPPPPTHSLYIFCPSTTTLELFYMHSKLNLIAQQPYGFKM